MIFREIAWRAPLAAFAPISGEPFAVLLSGGERAIAPGWSAIAAFPARVIEARGGAAFIDGAPSGLDPFAALGALHQARRSRAARASPCGPPPPMTTGLYGYVGYEMGAALEPSAAGPASPFALPDMAIGAYDAVALFDRRARRAFISARTEEAAGRLAGALGEAAPARLSLPDFRGPVSNFTAQGYEEAVAAAIELIRDGAIFQANLAQQLSVEAGEPFDPFALYQRLAAGDAPFAAFLQYRDGAIVSNSPERFFRIAPAEEGARIVAEPIKGTRPRGASPAEDRALAEALIADPKERAENVMIADLARNDLSRFCKDGSIREEAICALASFAGVHHLVSRISGALREEASPVDALGALFPCGSVTGAPKIEAMRTIAALEPAGRGPYCGAIGYIDDRGHADFSVAIRTMIVSRAGRGARVVLPVGGGVTLRSDPALEYEETLVKARGLLAALGLGEAAAA